MKCVLQFPAGNSQSSELLVRRAHLGDEMLGCLGERLATGSTCLGLCLCVRITRQMEPGTCPVVRGACLSVCLLVEVVLGLGEPEFSPA